MLLQGGWSRLPLGVGGGLDNFDTRLGRRTNERVALVVGYGLNVVLLQLIHPVGVYASSQVFLVICWSIA